MVLLIESVIEDASALGPTDLLELNWLERSRPRFRCKSHSGLELALALPRGTTLHDGAMLHNSTERTIIVRARAEEVLAIEVNDVQQLCLVAHQLGNWHRALQFEGSNCILTEPDSPLEEWLRRSKIKSRIECRPYSPNMLEIQHKITVSL